MNIIYTDINTRRRTIELNLFNDTWVFDDKYFIICGPSCYEVHKMNKDGTNVYESEAFIDCLRYVWNELQEGKGK